MEYIQYTVGYYRHSDNTEYRIRVYADSEEQALQIIRRKFQKFGEGDYFIVEDT
jgi:hypothetical protein